MDRISVIVPIYNVEDYLESCLTSILNQTYENLQIILVDDGSTDRSGQICDGYARKDLRVEVIHKENGGLVSARKAGLQQARGRYVTFVDGDDWIDPECYEYLLYQNQEYDADVIAYACVEEYQDFQKVIRNQIDNGFYNLNEESDLKESLFIQDEFFAWRILPHLWNKIIKTKLVRSSYDRIGESVSFGEDAACTFPCIMNADSLLVVNEPMYHYVQRKGSIVKENRELPRENFQEIYKVLREEFYGNKSLNLQLKDYMLFLLLLKKYSGIPSDMKLFPYSKISENARVYVYGAGGFGRVIIDAIKNREDLSLVGWTDQNYENTDMKELELDSVESMYESDFDYVVIAMLNEKTAEAVKNQMIARGIPSEKIDYVRKEILQETKLPKWLYEKEMDI